jgi:hypothetical protein
MSTEHLDELKRRLAEQTEEASTNDRVTTDRDSGATPIGCSPAPAQLARR